MMPADSEEAYQSVATCFLECPADAVGSEDPFRRHVVVADALHVDEVGSVDPQGGQVFFQLLQCLFAIGLTASRRNEEVVATLVDDLPQVVLRIAEPPHLRTSVQKRHSCIDGATVEADSFPLRSVARGCGAKTEDGYLDPCFSEDSLRQSGVANSKHRVECAGRLAIRRGTRGRGRFSRRK